MMNFTIKSDGKPFLGTIKQTKYVVLSNSFNSLPMTTRPIGIYSTKEAADKKAKELTPKYNISTALIGQYNTITYYVVETPYYE